MPELVNPAGLLWLSLVPLLLVPYLLRQRPRRRIIPALFLFAGIERAHPARQPARAEAVGVLSCRGLGRSG